MRLPRRARSSRRRSCSGCSGWAPWREGLWADSGKEVKRSRLRKSFSCCCSLLYCLPPPDYSHKLALVDTSSQSDAPTCTPCHKVSGQTQELRSPGAGIEPFYFLIKFQFRKQKTHYLTVAEVTADICCNMITNCTIRDSCY